MYKIFHLICNRPAMLYETRPVNGERIMQDKCRRLDGTVYGDGEVPYCGSCGRRLYGQHLIPDPNEYKVYDMSSDEDMAVIYGPAPGEPGPRTH
jgi:hypothetical protein